MSSDRDPEGVNVGWAMARLAVEWAEKVQRAGTARQQGDESEADRLLVEADELKAKVYKTAGA